MSFVEKGGAVFRKVLIPHVDKKGKITVKITEVQADPYDLRRVRDIKGKDCQPNHPKNSLRMSKKPKLPINLNGKSPFFLSSYKF